MLFNQRVDAGLNGSFLKPRADVVVRHVACTQWEIMLRLNDRKMSMDKNVKSGLTGKVILPDVVWHVFSAVSGGYNKVRRGGRSVGGEGGGPYSHTILLKQAVADVGHVVFPNNICALNDQIFRMKRLKSIFTRLFDLDDNI